MAPEPPQKRLPGMNIEGFRYILDLYQGRLIEENDGKWEPGPEDPVSLSLSRDDQTFSYRGLNKKARTLHLQSMIPQMRNFLQEGEEGKFYRWLGFMQGVLWLRGCYSLDELRDHNRGNCSARDSDVSQKIVGRIVASFKEQGFCPICTHDGEIGNHNEDCPMQLLG